MDPVLLGRRSGRAAPLPAWGSGRGRLAFLLFLLAGLLLAGCRPSSPPETVSSPAPAVQPLHLLLVTIDTLRADRLGCYGYASIETPHLDRLAARGVLFEDAVSHSPLTPPSHASIFTGLYPPGHGVRDIGGFALAEQEQTLAEILAERGWYTGALVASPVLSRVFGLDQGFASYDDRFPRSAGQDRASHRYRPAREMVDRALHWLDRRPRERPFFLWLHLYDPHAPYHPPSPFRERYSGRPYDGEIAYSDLEVGRLLQRLEAEGLEGDTLVTVLSDHGESLGEHGEQAHGVFLYDSTLKIPWILAGPGIPSGGRIRSQARTIDLLPTLLELLGIPRPPHLQGTSLVPAFTGRRVDTTYSYAETLFPRIHMGWAELRAVRSQRWKYVRAPRPELYDLAADPGETVNLVERYPVEARRMENRLKALLGADDSLSEEVQSGALDAETRERLRSLGYVSLASRRSIRLTGQGADPKDQISVLHGIEESTTTLKPIAPEERIRLLRQALEEDPANPTVCYLLGEAYEKRGRNREALELYRRAVRQEQTATSQIYARLAGVLGRLGKLSEATEAFRKAVELDPLDLESQNRLAVALLMAPDAARLREARLLLEGILSQDPDNSQAHNTLGWMALRQGELEEARRHLERAAQIDPGFLEVYINLGLLYQRLGRREQAREAFETFLEEARGTPHAASIPRVEKLLAALRAAPSASE